MPPLSPELDPAYLPPSVRPGAALLPGHRSSDARRRDRQPDVVEEVPPTLPSLEPGSLLTTARNLLDALLGTILDDPDAAVRALLALGAREGARRRALPAHDAASGAPIATTPLARAYVHDFLATEVRETIGVYVAAGVADDLVGRATMGVEFVAGVETEAPGTVDAASPTA